MNELVWLIVGLLIGVFNVYGDAFDDECYDYEKILKECIIQCKIRR